MKRIPWIAAAAVFLVHAAGNPHYGFFRDELYFIICGFHPQWGYVDQPPVVPLLAAGTQLFGHSLFLLRLVPALCAAAGTYVTCLLAVEFGGGAFAQVLAALLFLFTPVLMSFGMKVVPDEIGLWSWPLIALLAVRIVKGADPRTWLLAGVVAGISIQSKYMAIFFLIALVGGFALTPQRRILANRWFGVGAGVMLLIVLPNLLWQAANHFPMWELLRAGQEGKNIIVGPVMYLAQQVLITNLFLFAAWIVGLYRLLRIGELRFLGYAYVIIIVEMMLLHGKYYYPADIYPILLAAGAVQIDAWLRGRRLAQAAVLAYTFAFGLVFVPLVLPVLPVPQFLAYQSSLFSILHVPRSALATEHGRDVTPLPGDWADMHGWPQLAAAVKRIYDALPPAQRAQAVVMASNYGEASAIAFFAPSVPVVSGHNQYWLWGSRGYSGNVLIDVNGDCGASIHAFAHAQLVERFSAPYTIGWETDAPIMLCRGIRAPLASYWPELKEYL
ncbi:MAG TPA: glycosyltransferase family 39 protein [Candidatus Baltobacteraceae bacterium]|nr:glycosyltransferase family 39 protein [Candidatus Baltobacteraceae bacterium]